MSRDAGTIRVPRPSRGGFLFDGSAVPKDSRALHVCLKLRHRLRDPKTDAARVKARFRELKPEAVRLTRNGVSGRIEKPEYAVR